MRAGGFAKESQMLPTDSPLLHVIAEQTETVFFMDCAMMKTTPEIADSLAIPLSPLMIAFNKLNLGKEYIREDVAYVILGAKEFRRRGGLGLMVFRGVYYVKFRRPGTLRLESLVGTAPVMLIKGFPTWQYNVNILTQRNLGGFPLRKPQKPRSGLLQIWTCLKPSCNQSRSVIRIGKDVPSGERSCCPRLSGQYDGTGVRKL
jgi:hypothetical protein